MASNDSQSEKESQRQALTWLERQIERGSLFTHTIVSRNSEQIHETESFLYGVIDVLIEKGLLTQDEVLQSVERVRQEMDEKGQTVGPGIALRIEGEDDKSADFISVNCAERLSVCKAVCCRLHFALTTNEVEAGKVKWDLGAPYYIRHESTGCCHHLEPDDRGCSVYEDRPRVCQQYSCAEDERVWKDFEKMILNEEWIEENLQACGPRLISAQMMPEGMGRFPAGDEVSTDDFPNLDDEELEE